MASRKSRRSKLRGMYPQGINEESIGAYTIADLSIETPEKKRLIVDVKGRGTAAAAGRVRLLAWPTLSSVFLLHKPGQAEWIVRTASHSPLRQPLNHETFLSAAYDLLRAEE